MAKRQTIGDRVRVAREMLGISGLELDRRAHLSAKHTSKIENGERLRISAATLILLADALEVTVDWLANGDE